MALFVDSQAVIMESRGVQSRKIPATTPVFYDGGGQSFVLTDYFQGSHWKMPVDDGYTHAGDVTWVSILTAEAHALLERNYSTAADVWPEAYVEE